MLNKSVLIIEPHSDDASLGCYVPLTTFEEVKLVTVTYSGEDREKEHSNFLSLVNQIRLSKGLREVSTVNLRHRDGYSGLDIPKLSSSINGVIDKEYNVVLLPESSLHQDHEAVYRSSLIALRNSPSTSVYTYEYPEASSQFYSSSPNTYLKMSEDDVRSKGELIACYKSQLHDLRNSSAIIALSRMRGLAVSTEYAEAYTLVRSMNVG